MSAPTPEQVSAAREFCAEHSDANPEHFAKWLAAREAAAYARGVEDAAKVAKEARAEWKSNADRPQSEHSGPSYAAAVAGEAASRDIAERIAALLPGTASAGSDNKDGAA